MSFCFICCNCMFSRTVCVCFKRNIFILACVETFGTSKVFALSKGCSLFQVLNVNK